jgi:hypothetical protein
MVRLGLGGLGSVLIGVACALPPVSAPVVATPESESVVASEQEASAEEEEAKTWVWLGEAVTGPVPPGGPPIACGLQRGELTLVDGGLRCRELPVEVSFPPGTKISRSDNDYRTTFEAKLEGGSLALMVERIHARGVICELDFCHFDAMDEPALQAWLEVSMRARAGDRVRPPDVAGASLSLGLRHEGKNQVVGAHGYVIDGWLVTLVARGGSEAAVRPDGPIGSAFLRSIRPRDVDHSSAIVEIARRERRSDYRVALELPRSFWSADQFLQAPTGESSWYLELPSSGRILEIHVDTSTVCESSRKALVEQAHFDNRRRNVRLRPREKVAQGLYYETRVKRQTAEVWYSHCHQERVAVALGLSDGVSTADELEAELRTYVATLTFE